MSTTTLALDSNYVNATGGDAIATRFILPAATTLATVYFFVVSYTGTAANVNDLNLELRNNSGTTGPGSTLHESQTKDPASATGWVSSTGWTFSLSADTFYWVVLGDADGNGTDFATVLRNTNRFIDMAYTGQSVPVQTTDGWTSVRTFGSSLTSLLLVLGNGVTIGTPYTAVTNSTNGSNRRGLRFIAPAQCKIYGATTGLADVDISGIELWSGAGGPSGTADATGVIEYAVGVLSAAPQGFAFATSQSVIQGAAYRLVFTYSGAAASPARAQIGTGADATLRSAMQGLGNWYYTEANGTTDWSNDNTSEFPVMDVVIDDFVTNTSGGISSGLHTIMDGIVA